MLRDELLRRFPALRTLPPGCFVVGGAVRDLLLGVPPLDVDVTCLDPESAARRLGERPVRLGAGEHLSAWRLTRDGNIYDFAAMLDGEISADLARRDFTINAMAVGLSDGSLLDPHDGQGDLCSRLVRMVDASNFDDDPLRCLKAVRMAVRLGFDVDPATMEAIRQRAPRITSIAPERVTYELTVILAAGQFRRSLDLLHQTGLDVPLFGRQISSAGFTSDDVTPAGALALLVEDEKSYAKRWRWSREVLRDVTSLKALLALASPDPLSLYDAGERVAVQIPPLLCALGRDGRIVMPDFALRSLLSGEEIAALTGLVEGAALGALKRSLLEAQIRGEVKTVEEARKFVRSAS